MSIFSHDAEILVILLSRLFILRDLNRRLIVRDLLLPPQRNC